jgi:hypothetical protein
MAAATATRAPKEESQASTDAAMLRRIEGIESVKRADKLKTDPDPGRPVLVLSTGETLRTSLAHGRDLARKILDAREGRNLSALMHLGKHRVGGTEQSPVFLEEVLFHPSDKDKVK